MVNGFPRRTFMDPWSENEARLADAGVTVISGTGEDVVFAVDNAGVAFACGWSAMHPAKITRSAASRRKVPVRCIGFIVRIRPDP
jgi:hypothetical protein